MGIISSIFNTSDYGASGYADKANNAYDDADHVIGAQTGIAGQYGSLASQNLGQYQGYDKLAQGANTAYDNYLSTDPRTDQRFSELVARGIGNSPNQYAKASANNLVNMYSRGLDTPESGGASSVGASTQAYLSSQQALQAQQAKANAANQLQAEYGTRLGQRSNFNNGLASQAYSRGVGALGAQNSIYGQQYGEYSGIAGAYNGMASQARQRQSADNAEITGLIGDVAGAYGAGSVHAPQAAAAVTANPNAGYSPSPYTGSTDYGGIGGYINNSNQYFAPGEATYDTNPYETSPYAM
jgi:hypothetical protein